jgi:hypothetical protein
MSSISAPFRKTNVQTKTLTSELLHVVNEKAEVVRVYLPPDANCPLSVTDHCLSSISRSYGRKPISCRFERSETSDRRRLGPHHIAAGSR